MTGGETIYVLDEVTPKPGQGEAFLKAYMEHYAPAALTRGMTLEHTLVMPPVWLTDQSNRLFIVWSVPGLQKLWSANYQASNDPSVDKWWQEARAMIVTRQRSLLSEASDLASLANV